MFPTYLISGVHSQTAGAGDQISPLEKPQGVLESLLAVARENLRVGRDENSTEPDHVVFTHLYTGPGYLDLRGSKVSEVGAGTDVLSHLEDGEDVVVLGADVAVTTERRHRHGVGVQHRQVVAVAAVNDPDAAVAGRKPPRENRNEGGGEDDLEGRTGLEK